MGSGPGACTNHDTPAETPWNASSSWCWGIVSAQSILSSLAQREFQDCKMIPVHGLLWEKKHSTSWFHSQGRLQETMLPGKALEEAHHDPFKFLDPPSQRVCSCNESDDIKAPAYSGNDRLRCLKPVRELQWVQPNDGATRDAVLAASLSGDCMKIRPPGAVIELLNQEEFRKIICPVFLIMDSILV